MRVKSIWFGARRVLVTSIAFRSCLARSDQISFYQFIRDAITSDVLVWLDLVVENPLNSRLTDDVLIRIASKAHGRLQTLALLSCSRITDECLMSVIIQNRFISKLYVPGCTSITPERLLEATEKLPSLKHVKIDGIYNFNQQHLQLLHHNLPNLPIKNHKFYHKYQNPTFRSINQDNSTIDVEVCPKCAEIKLVFNCPREACRERRQCVGCERCVPRYEGCGICITNEYNDEDLGETPCNDILCLECWRNFPKCSCCNKCYCPRHLEEMVHSDADGSFICEICEDYGS